jgi:hypothetical protein
MKYNIVIIELKDDGNTQATAEPRNYMAICLDPVITIYGSYVSKRQCPDIFGSSYDDVYQRMVNYIKDCRESIKPYINNIDYITVDC